MSLFVCVLEPNSLLFKFNKVGLSVCIVTLTVVWGFKLTQFVTGIKIKPEGCFDPKIYQSHGIRHVNGDS